MPWRSACCWLLLHRWPRPRGTPASPAPFLDALSELDVLSLEERMIDTVSETSKGMYFASFSMSLETRC